MNIFKLRKFSLNRRLLLNPSLRDVILKNVGTPVVPKGGLARFCCCRLQKRRNTCVVTNKHRTPYTVHRTRTPYTVHRTDGRQTNLR
jgi:hypothetical protein